MTHYIEAVLIKWNHRDWPIGLCLHVAKKERGNPPTVNLDGVIYGVCAVVAAVLIVAPWLTRAGCGV